MQTGTDRILFNSQDKKNQSYPDWFFMREKLLLLL